MKEKKDQSQSGFDKKSEEERLREISSSGQEAKHKKFKDAAGKDQVIDPDAELEEEELLEDEEE